MGSNEWLGCGSTQDHVHHWGFDFEETDGVQIVSQEGDDLGSGLKNLSVLWVQHQIEISVSISGFVILELLWQHVETWGEELHLTWEDGEFSGLGHTWGTLNTDDITSSKGRVEFEKFLVM